MHFIVFDVYVLVRATFISLIRQTSLLSFQLFYWFIQINGKTDMFHNYLDKKLL